MAFVIDSIENEIARCVREDKSVFTVSMSKLPKDAKVQDWIIVENNSYKIDKELTAKYKEKNLELYKKLKKKR